MECRSPENIQRMPILGNVDIKLHPLDRESEGELVVFDVCLNPSLQKSERYKYRLQYISPIPFLRKQEFARIVKKELDEQLLFEGFDLNGPIKPSPEKLKKRAARIEVLGEIIPHEVTRKFK